MSRENVAGIRRSYDALNEGDLDAVLSNWAPDAEYVATGGHLTGLAGVYRGAEHYRKGFLEPFRAEFAALNVEVHELLDAGEHVVASLTIAGRGRRSGAEVAWDVWQVWTFREGRVIRGQGYGSREEALGAAGLRATPP